MRYGSGSSWTIRSVLARLAAGDPVLGLGVRGARTGDIARMASASGYDVIWIDLEHSSMSVDIAAQIAATAHDVGLAAWVRVPEREYGVIGRLLDGGATGIIAPKIETAEEARLVADACRFPPKGQRSQIALLPQNGFARMPADQLNRRANDGVVLQILLESARGIANADAIAAVDGVDLLGIGMNDLTADLGCRGDYRNPAARAACEQVAAAAAAHGKVAIVGGIPDSDYFVELLGTGFAPLIFAGIDTDILAGGIAARAADWRARLPADSHSMQGC